VLVNYIREFQLDRGVPSESAYTVTVYILAGLLFLGFISNLLVRPVKEHHMMSEEELETEHGHLRAPVEEIVFVHSTKPAASSWAAVVAGWTLVGIPLAWGILKTVEKAASLFI
jgi:hypothetical protein